MLLYVSAYSFTVLRMQVVLFLFMELILLYTIIRKILGILKHKDAYIFYIVITSTYILNILICNVDVINLINKLITG